jgi:hypothetical protein
MKDDRKEFYEKELVPQLDAYKLLLSKAERAIEEGSLEDATLFLNSALLINPDDKTVQRKLEEVRKLRAKEVVLNFIQKFYPEELDLFDIAWRVFKDILPEDFKQETVRGDKNTAGPTS